MQTRGVHIENTVYNVSSTGLPSPEGSSTDCDFTIYRTCHSSTGTRRRLASSFVCFRGPKGAAIADNVIPSPSRLHYQRLQHSLPCISLPAVSDRLGRII